MWEDGERPIAVEADLSTIQHSDSGDSDAGSHSSQWNTSSDDGELIALLAHGASSGRPDHDVHAALHDLSTKVFDQAQRVLTAPCWLPGCAFPGCGFWDAASQVSLVANARRAVCGGCGVARYCCWACRRADWGWRHRKVCSSLRRELQEASAAAAAAEGAAGQQGPAPAAGSSSSDADAASSSSNSSAEQVAGVQTGPSNGQQQPQQQQQQQRPAPRVKVWPGMLAFALQQDPLSEQIECDS
jgi:hypothetical protein